MPESLPVTKETDIRVRRLERRLTLVTIALVTYIAVSIFVMLYDLRAQRRAFWSTSVFAGAFHLPPPQAWSAHAVSAGLAPDVDGKNISFWLAPGVLRALGDPRGSRHEVRIDLDALGSESLTFRDRRGKPRLRLALAADGSPSITCLAADGAVAWAAPLAPK